MTGEWAPVGPGRFDVTRPNTARMYDYWLGGKDNFAVDREAAEKIVELFPQTPRVAWQNRQVMRRATAVFARAGIRQFIDLGSGLPTQDNLHQVAQQHVPDARVVYVDHDPIVLVHGRALLADNEFTTVVTADLRDPELLLADPDLGRLIDFDQPIGLMLIAVLHFIPDSDDPAAIIGTFLDRMVPGSHLMITHVTDEGADCDAAAEAVDTYKNASSPLVFRSPAQIGAFFTGLEVLDPGIVPTWEWRPDGALDTPTSPRILAGAGRVR